MIEVKKQHQSRCEAPLSYVPLLLPLPLQGAFSVLGAVTVVTTHDKRPQVSFWWTWGQFLGSHAGLCPRARTIPLPTGVTAGHLLIPSQEFLLFPACGRAETRAGIRGNKTKTFVSVLAPALRSSSGIRLV